MIRQLKNILLILSLLVVTAVKNYAQQGNNWYFGYKGGLSFNTNPPSPLTDGMLSTLEGCSSISDENGNLLFYTDGSIIYNRNHQVMPNGAGLLGHYSATQAALIVQRPGSNNIYYIFTANSQGFNLGIGYRYSIVDINLNNGIGDVIQKNVLLYAPCTERLTAVRHANGIDIWIITNEFESNFIKTYKIDCNGLDPTPVISASGIVLGGDETKAIGHFKVSPDGKILCQTIIDQSISPVNCFQLFQFDNTTGQVSAPIKIPTTGSNYGAEFSPNSKLLYISSAEAVPVPKELFQYSVNIYDSALIHDSRYIIATLSFSSTALQIGPDQKIYQAKLDSTNLGVINNPNIQGAGCNYISKGVSIGGKSGSGLPTFMGNYLVNQNASITVTPNTDCSSINFQGATSITGSVNWLWDFGDGTNSNNQNPIHTFPSSSNQYTVTLTVTPQTGCGKASAFTKINLTRPLLKAVFQSSQVCGNPAVQFSDQSTISESDITSWHWSFGDGSISNAKSPTHTYANTGDFTVKLIVSYASSCTVKDSMTKVISIEPKPVANFSITNACAGKSIQFTNLTSISAGSVNQWYWNLGDGTISTQQHPAHTYTIAGTYHIKMAAQSATGCISDTVYRAIEVSHKPNANFTIGNGCISFPVMFNDASSVVNATINQWYWNFDNGTTGIANPSHTFNVPGNYLVKLAVTSDKGCVSDTFLKTVTIDAKPVASFTIDKGCTGKSIVPVNKSSSSFGNITNHLWFWGSGHSSNQSEPAILFTEAGNHTVKMVAYSEHGCISDTALVVVNIEASPVVDFDFGNTCAGKAIVFSNHSIGLVTSWQWDFGDGYTSDQKQPTYIYHQYGQYSVNLTATTLNGCTVKTEKPVLISKIVVNAGNDTIIASGQPLQLNATGAQMYNWQPATYLNSTTGASPIAVPDADITYYLQGITSEGCMGYDTIHIRTFKEADVYVPTAFTPNADGKNDIFKPVYAGIRELVQFTVYNRWGQTVFTAKNMSMGWDGTFSGKEQDTNTFVWTAQAITYDRRVIVKRGTVTLIR